MRSPLPRLQLVETSPPPPRPHPDLVILDRITDSVARENYRKALERGDPENTFTTRAVVQ